ncbi:hypothetical protein [Robiginitalea aurantiaca]|uniref:Cardiolipin synthetase n=1 Tax=Robiginitalea aurantiaca TaxID=3056915 RepID=A0ABT7WCQ1_9FLAO|nr:hypothetical protein [Robiginitalea aurantiaca]MDM9630709.1 hypothetical protein [Robiginitalea aurantiaca]
MNFWRVFYNGVWQARKNNLMNIAIKKHSGLIYAYIGVLLLFSCGSLREESQYKNPETVLFHANKVLVVGMVSDYGTRLRLESHLKDAFAERGVEAMRSVDLFDVAFTASERTEAELDKVEQQLLDKDFDAILFSKRIDSDTRSQLSSQLAEMGRSYERFSEDYLIHQGIYYDEDKDANQKHYTAETSLYCICTGKERELIWRSDVRLPKRRNSAGVIDNYADWLIQRLEDQQLIIGHESF